MRIECWVCVAPGEERETTRREKGRGSQVSGERHKRRCFGGSWKDDVWTKELYLRLSIHTSFLSGEKLLA